MKKIAKLLSLALLITTLSSCNYSLVSGTNLNTNKSADWSDKTHSNSAIPDYDIVFPDNKVNRIDIDISESDWKLMQDNMTNLLGEPGERGNRGGPGGAGGERPERPEEGNPDNRPERNEGGGPGGGRPGGGGERSIDLVPEDPIYRPAKITFEGKVWNNVGIRYKGNSSLRSSWGQTKKLPFKLDFDEFEDQDENIKNQRFYGFKKLTFASNYSDNSYLREKVADDLFREAGVPAAKASFYRVYVDYGEGSEYFGLYTMVEAPDTPMLQKQFSNSSGNLYKPDGNGAKLVEFDQASFPKKTNEDNSDWSDIQALFSALHSDRSNIETWKSGLERVFNVAGFLKYLAVNNVIQNWDTYGTMTHNYYLYNDPSNSKVNWIPWDNNESMSERSGRGVNLDVESVGDDWPMIRYLLDIPEYEKQYQDFIQEFVNNVYTIESTTTRLKKEHALIKPYVNGNEGEQADSTMLNQPEDFDQGLTDLITHLEKRHEAVKEYLSNTN